MSKDVKGTFNGPHLRFWKKQCPESLVIILVRQTCSSGERLVMGKAERSCLALPGLTA